MRKNIVFVIVFMIIGLVVVQAQVPLPSLPQVTLTMPPHPTGGTYNVNVTSTQLLRLFEIRDQRMYLQYLLNSGYISRDEFRERDLSLEQSEVDLILPIIQADQVAYIYLDEYIKDEIQKIWYSFPPGMPSSQIIQEILGFVIQQPQGTRVTSFTREGGWQRIQIYFTHSTDQVFNNLKQQLETGFRTSMTHEPNNSRYTYVHRSANGKTYTIWLSNREGRIYINIEE